MAVVADGRPAVTSWKVREEFPFATLLEARPETGRTHQIRVHLSHLRRPVMGDKDYGGSKSVFGDVPPHYRRQAKRVNANASRQALHARELSLPAPVRQGRGQGYLADSSGHRPLCCRLLRFPDGESGRVLGVDPGEVRVGVAVSDESRLLARPLSTLTGLDDLGVAAAIAGLCDEMEASVVVVGLSDPNGRHDGSEGGSFQRAGRGHRGRHPRDGSSCRTSVCRAPRPRG